MSKPSRHITHRSRVAIVLIVVGFVLCVFNPNFAVEDFASPSRIHDKISSNRGFIQSGRVYLFSIAVLSAAVIGALINLMKGRFFESQK